MDSLEYREDCSRCEGLVDYINFLTEDLLEARTAISLAEAETADWKEKYEDCREELYDCRRECEAANAASERMQEESRYKDRFEEQNSLLCEKLDLMDQMQGQIDDLKRLLEAAELEASTGSCLAAGVEERLAVSEAAMEAANNRLSEWMSKMEDMEVNIRELEEKYEVAQEALDAAKSNVAGLEEKLAALDL